MVTCVELRKEKKIFYESEALSRALLLRTDLMQGFVCYLVATIYKRKNNGRRQPRTVK